MNTLGATTSATSQALAEWTRIFPRQVTETYTSSVTFMKQLTTIAVCTITYLKNIFPQESYTVEKFGGINVRILKKKCRDELAQFVSTGLTQAFEAFDRKYLHQLALCFYDGECNSDNLIEYMLFEYSYNNGGVTLDVRAGGRGDGSASDTLRPTARYTFDSIREHTLHLVRACVIIAGASQRQLPADCDVSLRLYYNDSAPPEYQAPGFTAASPAQDHLAKRAAERLAAVATPFHRLLASYYTRETAAASHEAIASQNVPVMTQNDDFNSGSRSVATSVTSEIPLRCPCNNHCDGDDLLRLTCYYCGTQQHAWCFGVRTARAQHCCARCADDDAAREPTDKRLAALPDKKRESLCIYRCTLAECACATTVSAGALASRFALSRASGARLMRLLHAHGLLRGRDTDFNSPREIIHEQVAVKMKEFFQLEEPEDAKEDMVERLIAETLSQGSTTDPVGEVLAPMERKNLQNASNVGKIVQHTPPETVIEDSTLKQYREAILSSDQKMDEDLPLSGSHNPVKDIQKIGKKTTKRKIDQEEKQLRSGVKTKRVKVETK